MVCVLCVKPFGHGGDLLICVLCIHVGPFGHGADLLACVLCAEPFGHGGDLIELVCGMEVISWYVYCVLSHLGMEVIS